MPMKVHEIYISQSDPNSSGRQTITFSAYGDNGLYKGSFDVIYAKSSYYITEAGSVTRAEDATTITYSYHIDITEASLPNNSTVTLRIYDGICAKTKKYAYKGLSSYIIDCTVKRYIPPTCTEPPCEVPPLKSEGNMLIGIDITDSSGQYILNRGAPSFHYIITDDYDE
jgi:hypothetical protein